jgi:hypothetical protein
MRTWASLAIVAASAAADPLPPQPKIAPDVAAKVPGVLVAARTDHDSTGGPDAFAIWRLGSTGAVELFSETIDRAVDAFHWLDAHTLVALDDHAGTWRVRWFVDGKLDAARTVELRDKDWPAPPPQGTDPLLAIGKHGEVWLHFCAAEGKPCKREVYLRADAKPFATVSKRPAGVDDVAAQALAPERKPQVVPAAKAPPGVTVKLQNVRYVDASGTPEMVKGFTCTAGGATATWPAPGVTDWRFDVQPERLHWIAAAPPLFYVEGKLVNPVDQVSHERRYFRACDAAAMDAFLWLGGGLWARMARVFTNGHYVNSVWSVYLDDAPLAALPGSDEWFEVAPR